MKKMQIQVVAFLITLLAMAGKGEVSYAKGKKPQKKDVAVAVQPDALRHSDRLRYNYFFLEAVRQQNAGNYAASYDLLSRCLQIDTCAAEAYYLQAMYLSMMRQDSLALGNLEKAAQLRPDNDTYQEKVAQFYIGTGNIAKGIEAYERLVSTQRNRSDVLNFLLQLYQRQEEYDKMLGTIDRLERVEGENEQFALSRMRVYELMGDTKNAYKTLKTLADSHPNDMTYVVMLGNWMMQNNKQKEAYKCFEQALKSDPDNAYAQSSMYDYYRAAGQDEQAGEMMERILLGKNTPSDNRLQFFRQAIQENERQGGDSLKIISLLNRMQESLPKDAALAEMRVAYYTIKKMPKAEIEKALVELLDLAPDNGGARFQLIQSKWAEEDWKAVSELSEPGMLYNPDEMAFYYFTGLARYYQKDDAGALDAFQRGTAEINAKSDAAIVSDFYAMMGGIYRDRGEKEKAYAAFDSCLQWKPDHMMTLNNYAYYLSLDGGDLKRAEEMSAMTIKAEPKNATYLDTYAWILYCQNRYAEAKIYIDQVLQYGDSATLNAEVLEHAGDIYVKAGYTAEALDMWQRAIDAGGDKAAIIRKTKLYNKKK